MPLVPETAHWKGCLLCTGEVGESGGCLILPSEVDSLELPSNWPFYFAGLFDVIIHCSHPFVVSNADLVVLSETDASYWIKDRMRSNSQLRVLPLTSCIGQGSIKIRSGEKNHTVT